MNERDSLVMERRTGGLVREMSRGWGWFGGGVAWTIRGGGRILDQMWRRISAGREENWGKAAGTCVMVEMRMV